jgi:beta-lactamase class C
MNSVLASQGGDFDKALSELGDSDEMVGLAVAIVRDGEVSFMQTYGVRELGGVAKITPETTFRIASLSKAFAATVAVQLEQEQKLVLSDSAILSNRSFQLKSQAQAKSATLVHVLSHRLSLPPYAYDNLLEAGVAPKKILSEMKNVQPICTVGSCYSYQNVGFNMIAPAIEIADKQSYVDSVSKRVFTPLKMSGASFGKENLMSSGNWAQSHKRRRGAPWKAVSVKQPYYDVPAAGGVNANIVDMSKWLVAQMGYSPQVLSNDVLKRLHAPQTKTARELRRVSYMRHVSEAYYGLGWRIYQYAGATVVNHSGSVEGYGAQIAFMPEKDVGLVLLTNSNTKKFWRILPKFLNHELGLNERKCDIETQFC